MGVGLRVEQGLVAGLQVVRVEREMGTVLPSPHCFNLGKTETQSLLLRRRWWVERGGGD